MVYHLVTLTLLRNLKAGFNSPGGYASVNHQHYHLYYLRERLYLEKAVITHLTVKMSIPIIVMILFLECRTYCWAVFCAN